MSTDCNKAGTCDCTCHHCGYGSHCRLQGNGCHLSCTAPPVVRTTKKRGSPKRR